MRFGSGSSRVERNLLCEQDVEFLNVPDGGTFSNHHA